MIVKIQAMGMIEFNSIAAGVEAADAMVKAAVVEPLLLKTICPGKFVAGVHGDVASVEAAVDAGLAMGRDAVVDHFVIPNIHLGVITAMSATVAVPQGPALGVIETFTAASSVLAADHAIKAADVNLIEVRLAMGLGGKAFVTLSGDVAAVETSVRAGAGSAAASGLLVRSVVIPRVAPEVWRGIV